MSDPLQLTLENMYLIEKLKNEKEKANSLLEELILKYPKIKYTKMKTLGEN